MASGHVNRTKRPNTWLHRPTCVREESPCQPGAVHTWHYPEMPEGPHYFRLLTCCGPRADLPTDCSLTIRYAAT